MALFKYLFSVPQRYEMMHSVEKQKCDKNVPIILTASTSLATQWIGLGLVGHVICHLTQ